MAASNPSLTRDSTLVGVGRGSEATRYEGVFGKAQKPVRNFNLHCLGVLFCLFCFVLFCFVLGRLFLFLGGSRPHSGVEALAGETQNALQTGQLLRQSQGICSDIFPTKDCVLVFFPPVCTKGFKENWKKGVPLRSRSQGPPPGNPAVPFGPEKRPSLPEERP